MHVFNPLKILTESVGIVCDAVGTLFFFDPLAATVYYRVATKYGSRLSECEIAERFIRELQYSEDCDLKLIGGP